MGDGDRQAPCKHNCGEHASGSRPQSTSSTLGPRLNERVRGLGAFPAHTEVARTIASTHGMRRIEPPGRGNAASAANTGGIYCVWSCECGQPSIHCWIGLWGFLVCRAGRVFSCSAAVRVSMFCTCSIPVLNCVQQLFVSSHHHIRLVFRLVICVPVHIWPYILVGFVICHEPSAIQLLPS